MNVFTTLIYCILFTSFFAQDSLTVVHSGHFLYAGDSDSEVVVDSYLLSDSSLYFIKVLFAHKEYTLPQTVSGSGVRYSDGMDMTWWESGDSASVQHRDTLGNWETAEIFWLK